MCKLYLHLLLSVLHDLTTEVGKRTNSIKLLKTYTGNVSKRQLFKHWSYDIFLPNAFPYNIPVNLLHDTIVPSYNMCMYTCLYTKI